MELRDGQHRGTVASGQRVQGDSERTGGPVRCAREWHGVHGVSEHGALGRREAALGRRAWGADTEGGHGLARPGADARRRGAGARSVARRAGVFCLDSVSVCPCLTVFFSRFLN
jgi:hypothetical protein